MREFKASKCYFGRLYFYYEPNSFIFPISTIIDKGGIVICFGHWGLTWSWNKETEDCD